MVWIADWADDAVHLNAQHARLGKDAVLRHLAVTLGGEVVRTSVTVRYDAAGGDAELLGLYFADDGQHLESRLLVDHSQPNCRSNVLYKGALQGDPDSEKPDAHTVWVGDVLIRAEASGTDTFEVNRNLVLTDGARADSVPNLEIETGEIAGAGHASAGQGARRPRAAAAVAEVRPEQVGFLCCGQAFHRSSSQVIRSAITHAS